MANFDTSAYSAGAENWTFAFQFDRVFIASIVENRGVEFQRQ